jgi:hypothetical protein
MGPRLGKGELGRLIFNRMSDSGDSNFHFEKVNDSDVLHNAMIVENRALK